MRKTWERCKSFHVLTPRPLPLSPTTTTIATPISLMGRPMVKSKSWSSFGPPSPSSTGRLDKRGGSKKLQAGPLVPHGCFSVYVGPDKQRFVIKIECTNHPLFRMLLEEAESEYGFHSDGPLVLPCDVDVFIKVLFEMEGDDDDISQLKCSFAKTRNSYHHLSSPRLVSLG